MRTFIFIMFLCLFASLNGVYADDGGKFVLLSKEERKQEKVTRKTFEYKEKVNKGILVYEIEVEEYEVEERRKSDIPASLGEKVVRIYDRSGRVIPGKVKVIRMVREERRGAEVVLVGFKRPLATGEKIKAKVKRIGVYENDGENLAVYQVVK